MDATAFSAAVESLGALQSKVPLGELGIDPTTASEFAAMPFDDCGSQYAKSLAITFAILSMLAKRGAGDASALLSIREAKREAVTKSFDKFLADNPRLFEDLFVRKSEHYYGSCIDPNQRYQRGLRIVGEEFATYAESFQTFPKVFESTRRRLAALDQTPESNSSIDQRFPSELQTLHTAAIQSINCVSIITELAVFPEPMLRLLHDEAVAILSRGAVQLCDNAIIGLCAMNDIQACWPKSAKWKHLKCTSLAIAQSMTLHLKILVSADPIGYRAWTESAGDEYYADPERIARHWNVVARAIVARNLGYSVSNWRDEITDELSAIGNRILRHLNDDRKKHVDTADASNGSVDDPSIEQVVVRQKFLCPKCKGKGLVYSTKRLEDGRRQRYIRCLNCGLPFKKTA